MIAALLLAEKKKKLDERERERRSRAISQTKQKCTYIFTANKQEHTMENFSGKVAAAAAPAIASSCC